MKALKEMILEKEQQMETLKTELAALRQLEKRTSNEPQKKRAPRSNVKQALFAMLESVGATGLNAATAVEMAAKDGKHLERGTISSLLSRLKHDGTVVYDGTYYRLSNQDPPQESSERSENVVDHPSSRVAS